VSGRDDPAPVADLDVAVALAEHLGQGPVAGQGQPQAQQMPALRRVGPVAKTGPVVKLTVVVDELHVARPETHLQMQRGVIGETVEHIERRDVIRRQPHRVGKALGAVDVLALVEHGQVARMPAERRDLHEGFHTLGHLAPPVRRDRVEQKRQEIGPFAARIRL
jgi:hypothetical protein